MSNRFWLREIKLTIGDKEWHSNHSNPLKIEFSVTSKAKSDNDTGSDIDLSEIKVFNLSEDSRNSIKKGDNVILNAGYKDSLGNILVGKVESVSVERQGMEIITVVKVTDGGSEWRQSTIVKTYRPGITASYIMRDVANTMGYEVAVIEPRDDITYKLGRSINGKSGDVLKQLVNETNSKLYVHKNRLYIMSKEDGIENGFLLNTNHGLLETPTKQESTVDNKTVITYNVKSKLNHELVVNSYIEIESMSINGKYRIEEVTHTSDFISELVVMEVR